jgi:hypothetical protein
LLEKVSVQWHGGQQLIFFCVLPGFLKKGKAVMEVLIKKEVIEMINDK